MIKINKKQGGKRAQFPSLKNSGTEVETRLH